MARYDFNNGFLRFRKALLGKADRPPVYAQMHEFALKNSKASGEIFYKDAELYVDGVLKTTAAYGLDVPDIVWDAYNLEAQALGVKVVFSKDASPALDQTPIIRNAKDLARLKIPDPQKAGRYQWAMDCMQIFESRTGVPASLCFCSPFSLASLLVGYEQLVMEIYMNPQFVHNVLKVLTEEVIAPFINTVLNRFQQCPSADGADALSSLPFLTEDMLAEFCIPYIIMLRDLCGDKIVVRNWWGDTCAKDTEAFWDQKLLVGNNILEVQDPDLKKIGAERVMAYASKKNVPVILGVDQNLLSTGTPAEIEYRIQTYINAADRHRKVILYLCNLNYTVPDENVHAAVRTARNQSYTG